jgi:hypothetical protein
MVFTTHIFLFYFLPLFLAVYFISLRLAEPQRPSSFIGAKN